LAWRGITTCGVSSANVRDLLRGDVLRHRHICGTRRRPWRIYGGCGIKRQRTRGGSPRGILLARRHGTVCGDISARAAASWRPARA